MPTRSPEGTPNPPAPWLYRVGPFFVGSFLRHRMKLEVDLGDIEQEQGPFVVLANHAAVYDPLVLAYALQRIPLNFVGGYDYFRVPGLRWLLQQLGAIRKFQYHTDLASLRAMSGVIQRGGRLALFPTGRLSTVGEGRSVTPALVKLLKKWDVPVYGVTLAGTYFIKPKWARYRRYGPVHVHVQRLLTQADLRTKSLEEILVACQAITQYDAYKDSLTRFSYQGKNLAEGLEKILYHCPVCHHEYELVSQGDNLRCTHCGSHWILQADGYFQEGSFPVSPHAWLDTQKDLLRAKIQEPNFQLQTVVTHRATDLRIMKKMSPEEGLLTMNEAELRLDRKDQPSLVFPLRGLDSLPFRAGANIEIASDTAVHTFSFDHGQQAIKWSLAVEVWAEIRKEQARHNG